MMTRLSRVRPKHRERNVNTLRRPYNTTTGALAAWLLHWKGDTDGRWHPAAFLGPTMQGTQIFVGE